jgi:hypothetical protein
VIPSRKSALATLHVVTLNPSVFIYINKSIQQISLFYYI